MSGFNDIFNHLPGLGWSIVGDRVETKEVVNAVVGQLSGMSKSTDHSANLIAVMPEQREIDAPILHLSDRQRTLLQRATALLTQLASAPSSETADAPATIRVALHQVLDTLATTHIALITGDAALGLPIAHSAAVHQIYFAAPVHVDRQLKHYLQQSAALLAQPEGQLSLADPELQQLITTDTAVLLAALETLVQQYRRESETQS
jgi:two-component system, NtrC family, sensor kinase